MSSFIPNTIIPESVDVIDAMTFFNEIVKLPTNTNTNKQTTCLISHDELCHPIAELSCSHAFNYTALHSCLFNQLYKTGPTITHYPKLNGCYVYFLCPYCRHPQTKLLPYYNDEQGKKIYSINADEMRFNPKNTYYGTVLGKCSWIINANNAAKATQCLCSSVKLHQGLNAYYCMSHLSNAKTKYQTILKKKSKLEAKEAKKKTLKNPTI